MTNSASFVAGAVSPGEMVAVFGSNLTSNVTFDGMQPTILFVSPAQINVTVPYGLTGSTTNMQVGTTSLQLAVAPAAPGIFATVSSGPGLLTLYATGGGRLSTEALPSLTLSVAVNVNGLPAEVLAPWTEVRGHRNSILRGWSNYFGYGTRLMAYRAVDHYVYERVRNFLRNRQARIYGLDQRRSHS